MKILLLTKYFPPEPGAGSSRAYEHAKVWNNLGCEVTILTCFPHYPDGIIPEQYQDKSYSEENVEGIKVIRTYTYATPNKGKIKRTLGFFSFMISSVVQGLTKIGKQDVIIASSPPITVGISGMLLSSMKKLPFIFEVRDLWPESIVQLGQIKNKWIINILEKIETLLYRKAAKVIGISDPFIDIIADKEIRREKIEIVKNGVDLALFNPIEEDKELKDSISLQNKFIVSYFGTFGLSHSLDKVLETAYLLKEEKKIHFLLIGDGAERENLIRIKKELSLYNVTILNTVKKEELKNYYSISDLMLVTLRNLPLFDSALPSKIFEILAMSKPILTTVDGEARRMIEKNNLGWFAEPENPGALSAKIKELYNSPALIESAAKNSRKYVEKQFNRQKLAEDYISIIQNVISN